MSMEVSIVRIGAGAGVKTLSMPEGCTIKDVLNAAGTADFYEGSKLKYEVRVNNDSTSAADTTVLQPNANGQPVRLFLTKMVKGNMEVSIVRIGAGAGVKTLQMPDGCTIKDVLNAAGTADFYDGSKLKYEVRVNNDSTSAVDTTVLQPNATGQPVRLFLTKMVKGNDGSSEDSFFDIEAALDAITA